MTGTTLWATSSAGAILLSEIQQHSTSIGDDMTYRVNGTLKLPDGSPAANCEIEFVSRKNLSPTVQGSKTNILTSAAGAYDVTLEFGEYAVILYAGGTYPAQAGIISVLADTTTGLDLPTLLGRGEWQPATPDYIKQIEAWLVSSQGNATAASASADRAESSAALAGGSEVAANASEVAAAASATSAAASEASAKADALSSASSAAAAKASEISAAADAVAAGQSASSAEQSRISAAADAVRAENAAGSMIGAILDGGTCDLSTGVYPTPITVNGSPYSTVWYVQVGGTVSGTTFDAGDVLRYTTASGGRYFKVDAKDEVYSVNGKKGAVVLSAADIGADALGVAASAVSAHEAKAGAHAIAGVAGLQQALDSKENSIREALRRSYAEAGFTLVDRSFEEGGTLTSATDVLLYDADGNGYAWCGALPKTVSAGSTPASSGGISTTAWLPRNRATESSQANPGEFELISHRGFMYLAPENTMSAFTNALALGVTSIETDVRISSDGVPVLMHDATVDRTTTGTGNVSSLTLATLKSLDASGSMGAAYSPARIPTLDEFASFAVSRAKKIYLEIKGYRTQSDIDLMMAVINKYKAQAITVWISFNLSDLQYIRARDPFCALGYVSNNVSQLDAVAALGGEVIYDLDYNFLIANPSAVTTCRRAGVDVGAWTIDDFTPIKTLVDIGVSKITSNRYFGKGY